ncbi:MAG: hypothetical protein HC937_03515, partial [Aquincola sp.]|nr:hypothetical protein [Aquincola sp.]
ELLYDFGGWYHFEFLRFGDEPFEDERVLRYHDVRLWGSLQISKRYRLYARVRNTYTDFNDGTQFGGTLWPCQPAVALAHDAVVDYDRCPSW